MKAEQSQQSIFGRLRQMLPDAPWDNSFWMHLLNHSCHHTQVSWVREFLASELKKKVGLGYGLNNKSQEFFQLQSEIQRFVGWALFREKAQLAKKNTRENNAML